MSSFLVDYIHVRNSPEQFIGISGDSWSGVERIRKISDDFNRPISRRRTFVIEFYELLSVWERDTETFSFITEICMHPAYLRIIAMGEKALPLILRELRKEPGHWFVALNAITGENPVKPEQRGKMKEMTMAWLQWAEERNIL